MPMAGTNSFADVMARLRAGDEAAAQAVFERFVGKLVKRARQQFDAVLRRKIDPEDVVQSAYKSFFVRYGEGKLEVHDWHSLWGLLTVITLRKCFDRVEYHRAECRNVEREAAAHPGAAGTEPWWEAVSREPTPEEATVLAETIEQILRELPASARPIFELSLQGYTAREISQQIGRAERSVRRLREQIRQRLEGDADV
jgi:RNA polymerase sigma-70 factor (ECF subfamily)